MLSVLAPQVNDSSHTVTPRHIGNHFGAGLIHSEQAPGQPKLISVEKPKNPMVCQQQTGAI
jgi:hypothetical protein